MNGPQVLEGAPLLVIKGMLIKAIRSCREAG
jgi:hypothetical protein